MKPKPTLAITHNEPPHIVNSLINKFGATNCIPGIQQPGDVQILAQDALIVVERKTPNDLLQTLRSDDDRDLYRQVDSMLKVSKWSYLVITGPLLAGPNGMIILDRGETGWNFDAVWGKLETVQEMGCTVTFCKNELCYADKLELLIDGNRGEVKIGAKRQSNILSDAEVFLMGIPGVGFEKSKSLLEFRPRPIDAIMELLNTNNQTVPGITMALKTKVRKFFQLQEDELVISGSELDLDFIKA